MCFGCAVAAGTMVVAAQFSPIEFLSSINSGPTVAQVSGLSFVSTAQRVQIERITDANPALQSFVCNGFRFVPDITKSNSTPC
jgi:hypothetical protein